MSAYDQRAKARYAARRALIDSITFTVEGANGLSIRKGDAPATLFGEAS